MEASCSPIEETAMDIGTAPPRSKSKIALSRRPSGYWKVFSNWWRGRYAALKTRPTVNEVIEWYHCNAASSWPVGQVPCLKAVLRQSKGLRPIDGLKEYFREYRKKRKQQGGLALKAGDDAYLRRSRPVRRRRGRAANKDSSDEEDADELEQEASACSDQRSSEEEDEEELEDVMPPRRQRRSCAAARRSAAAAEADAEATEAAAVAEAAAAAVDSPAFAAGGSPEAAGCAVQAVFDAWLPGADAASSGLEACTTAQLAAAVASADMASVAAVVMEEPDASFLPLTHALAVTASGDPVHPAVAQGMVPIASGGSPRTAAAVSIPHAPPMFGTCPGAAQPYTAYVQAVAAVRRPPSRLSTTSRRCGGPLALPPLSSSASPLLAARGPAAAAVAPSGNDAAAANGSLDVTKSEPGIKHESGAAQDDDAAGDRCSTGGGVPGPCDVRFARPPYMHEHAVDGYGYEYMYGPPPPYACHAPHPCCYRPAPYPMAYSYRAVSSAPYPPAGPDCSTGGGATSSFSSVAPWRALPTDGGAARFPTRQSSAESPAQLDACYPHPHPHHPAAWSPWGPADCGAPWQGGPPPPPHFAPHDLAAWGRGPVGRLPPGGAAPLACAVCSCGACSAAVPYHGCSSASPCKQHPQGMRPPPPHMSYAAYGPRHGGAMPAYPARAAEMWATAPPVPAGLEPHALRSSEGPSGLEGEACSSSVSEHDGQDATGRRSPCSGLSDHGSAQPAKPCTSPTGPGQLQQPPHWLRHPALPQHLPLMPSLGHGYGYDHHHLHAHAHHHHPPGYHPAAVPMYPIPRGLAATGSVTSLASLAPGVEEPPFCKAAAAGGVFHAGFAGAVRRCVSAVQTADAAAGTAAGDADVLPYLADAPAVPCGSEAAAKDAEGSLLSGPAEPHGPGLEPADCGLGLADGFGLAAREAMDHDLAFAFEDFMACDATFDTLAVCQ
ncbi:hypothetical protein PLESTB_000178100 [Pleodorina starrii]|uniref:Uncharacterized protein n=1 Tax=Pleodorina starrii TaxID=330485 RepID=A0A9W6BC52_9CHLO|nr:hypothetical protein PLESTM_000518600 [Pleodorina starrii]GLC49060.1 hypothetical protein PLESTB_000178100 [Pleodorina starrii]GLC66146.1 hypothetical protein PLESTF_000389900 [Pleodorina starrii]